MAADEAARRAAEAAAAAAEHIVLEEGTTSPTPSARRPMLVGGTLVFESEEVQHVDLDAAMALELQREEEAAAAREAQMLLEDEQYARMLQAREDAAARGVTLSEVDPAVVDDAALARQLQAEEQAYARAQGRPQPPVPAPTPGREPSVEDDEALARRLQAEEEAHVGAAPAPPARPSASDSFSAVTPDMIAAQQRELDALQAGHRQHQQAGQQPAAQPVGPSVQGAEPAGSKCCGCVLQ